MALITQNVILDILTEEHIRTFYTTLNSWMTTLGWIWIPENSSVLWSGQAFASSINISNVNAGAPSIYTPYRAFDNSTGNGEMWQASSTALPQQIGCDLGLLGNGGAIRQDTAVSYAVWFQKIGNDPMSWTFEGCNDTTLFPSQLTNWTVLDTQANQRPVASGFRSFAIASGNVGPYKAYRLNISACSGTAVNAELVELQIYNTVGVNFALDANVVRFQPINGSVPDGYSASATAGAMVYQTGDNLMPFYITIGLGCSSNSNVGTALFIQASPILNSGFLGPQTTTKQQTVPLNASALNASKFCRISGDSSRVTMFLDYRENSSTAQNFSFINIERLRDASGNATSAGLTLAGGANGGNFFMVCPASGTFDGTETTLPIMTPFAGNGIYTRSDGTNVINYFFPEPFLGSKQPPILGICAYSTNACDPEDTYPVLNPYGQTHYYYTLNIPVTTFTRGGTSFTLAMLNE